MKKITGIIMLSIFTISGTLYSQIETIYAKGGDSIVNWKDTIDLYYSNAAPIWYCCTSAPYEVKASSSLRPQGKYNYDPKNINDYDPRTAWIEGKSDYGIGESFSVSSGIGLRVYIFNGYQHSYSSWKNNSRVKKLRVYSDGDTLCYLELKDVMGGQYFNLPNNYDYPTWLKFEIVEVYKGDKWSDVAISEMHSKSCCFTSNTNILNLNHPLKIDELQNGNEISSFDIATGEIKATKVIQSVKQIHHTILKVSTEDHTVELTPTHPLFIKDYDLISLFDLKRKYKFNNYQEMLNKVEILVWNNEEQKSEYQKLIKIDEINGEFETYSILELEKGKTYIANGFITSVYGLK